MNLLEAIATQEGFYVPGSRSGRNNNPGDIDWGPFAQHHGATRIEVIPHGYNERARFAYFPTPQAGFGGMAALLSEPGVFSSTTPRRLIGGYAGATVEEALYRWAPPADANDTSAYVAGVCRSVGCAPTDCIDPLVAAAVVEMELTLPVTAVAA